MKKSTTNRGFKMVSFKDRYDQECSIQKSSLAFEDCIWLGVDNANPKIMSSKAEQYGLKVKDKTGWISYPIPDDILLHTRMHLTIDQVKELIPILTKFVETGEIY